MPVFNTTNELPVSHSLLTQFTVSTTTNTTNSTSTPSSVVVALNVVAANTPTTSDTTSDTISDTISDTTSSSNPSSIPHFNSSTLTPGGWLFYTSNPPTPTSTFTSIHMSDIILIGLGKDEDTGEDRVWVQVQTSEEEATEMTFKAQEGGDVKRLYELMTMASDETRDEEEDGVNGGGEEDSFAAFCKAVEGGATGFIGGGDVQDGQFDDE
mmetsp:Transcript_4862/g.9782  ORF Transcript_4862/g.9782 Transcript_4862/m.9782 type:complete len:211 (-) Transcript_4862:27-659(-)